MAGTVTADRLASGLGLATSQLAEGALFLKTDGTKALTAALNLGTNKLINVVDPTNPQDASTKNYTDNQITAAGANYIRRDGTVAFTAALNMGSQRITSLADPTGPQDAATKAYVDATAQGLSVKGAVRASTTSNIALSGTFTVDGVALSVGDRVLVKGQTTASENGIYVVAAGAWSRALDADASAELRGGTFVFVQEGSTLADTGWVVSTDGAVTLGTTAINWVQFSSAGTILAGNGLTKTANTVSILLPANSALNVSGAGLVVALDGTSLTKTATGLKITDPGAAKILIGDASGALTSVTLSGDATITAAGVLTIANALRAANHITGEQPSGLMNASNTTFTLAFAPVANTEALFYNGSRLARGSGEDYTVSGATITMISYIPVAGDKILVDYIK